MKREAPVVAVFGGAGAIGSAAVHRLAAGGFRIAALRHVRAVEGAEWSLEADLRSSGAAARFIREASDRFGRLDALVYAAGIPAQALLAATTDQSREELWQIQVGSAIEACRAALRPMLPAGRGSIVLLTSLAAAHPLVGQTCYASAHGALESFTRALAREVGGKGIRVNAVAPGMVEGGMTESLSPEQRAHLAARIPAGRFARPSEVAEAVAFLLSDAAGYITGEVLRVDGGGLLAGERADG